MGIYDELLQKRINQSQPKEISSPPSNVEKIASPEAKARKPASGQTGKPASLQAILPANPQTRKPANPLIRGADGDKPEKYTTRLTPCMIRKVKVFAAQQDSKDYEIVEKALLEYFERNT